jgi:hypothetical protein
MRPLDCRRTDGFRGAVEAESCSLCCRSSLGCVGEKWVRADCEPEEDGPGCSFAGAHSAPGRATSRAQIRLTSLLADAARSSLSLLTRLRRREVGSSGFEPLASSMSRRCRNRSRPRTLGCTRRLPGGIIEGFGFGTPARCVVAPSSTSREGTGGTTTSACPATRRVSPRRPPSIWLRPDPRPYYRVVAGPK